MVKTYTLHVAADADPGDAEALEKAHVVKDGFAWIPFVLGPFSFLWFFWNRLWLAGLGVLVLVVALVVALQALRVGPAAAFFAQFLLSLLIGLEASSLKRWTWRKRKPAVDVLTASDKEEAEAKAFSRWLSHTDDPRPSRPHASMPRMPYAGTDPVIGLFPDAERGR
jgi:hypothetical protein